MIKYISTFESLRKKAALSVAILISLTLIFITIISQSVFLLAQEINYIEEFEAESVESFLSQSLTVDKNFLELWKNDWESYKELRPTLSNQAFIDSFIKRRLEVFPLISTSSVVLFIKHENEIIYIGFKNERYSEYQDLLSQAPTPTPNETVVLNSNNETRFGDGNRIFLSGITLYDKESNPLYLYVGFEEKIMYNTYINALNIDALYQAKSQVNKILYKSIVFMLVVIAYGILLMFLIRWFILKSVMWFAKVHPFGEIAIKKGFLTKEQAMECLQDQNSQFKIME